MRVFVQEAVTCYKLKPLLNPTSTLFFWALVIPTAAKTLKCLLQSEPGLKNRNKNSLFPLRVKEDVAETLRAEANVPLLQTETGPQGIFESFVLKSPSLHIQRQYFPCQSLRRDGAAMHEFQSEVSALENSVHAADKKTRRGLLLGLLGGGEFSKKIQRCINSFQLFETKTFLFYFVFNLHLSRQLRTDTYL